MTASNQWPSPPELSPGVLCGLVLLAAVGGGAVARLARVPRVVGYLVAGLALRHVLVRGMAGGGEWEAAERAATDAGHLLQGIKTLALGLILFGMGTVFEIGHIRGVGRRVLRISAVELACVFALVGVACTVAFLLRGTGGASQALALGLLLASAALATAPAATVLVLREYDAKGPMGDTVMTLTALNNAVSIVLFHCLFLILAGTGVIDSVYSAGRMLWLDLAVTTVGSVALGVVLGFVLSVSYSRFPLVEFLLIVLAVMLALGEGDEYLARSLHLSFNFLLTCLTCGAVFANITLDQEILHDALRTLGGPVFAAFFVLAGYELHVQELGALGWVGAAYIVGRTGGKVLGGSWGARWAGGHGELRSYLGWGLLCQAGVAIGLADFLHGAWGTDTAGGYVADPLATTFKTIVLGSVVLFELIGPLALKRMAVSSGEVKAISLMRRRRASAAEGDSTWKLAFEAFRRALGWKGAAPTARDNELKTRHIMRSNIKLLRAAATMDEILHFVETSRFNHFPVVDAGGGYVGVIHFADLRDLIYDPTLRDLVTAADVADARSPAVTVDLPLGGLLEVFRNTDLGSLAVVDRDGGRVVGLVEQRDLLRVLGGASSAPPGGPPAAKLS